MRPSSSITRAGPTPARAPVVDRRRLPGGTTAALTTRVTPFDGYTLLAVGGEVDPSTADAFFHAIETAFLQAPTVVVDLQEVTFMDSSGINALVAAFGHHGCGDGGGTLVVRTPSPFVSRLLAITGLDQILTVQVAPEPPRTQ